MHQLLLLEDGEQAHALFRALDEHGEEGLWKRVMRLQRPFAFRQVVRTLHEGFIGDEMRHRGALTLCWNRRYGYISLIRQVNTNRRWTNGDIQRTKRHP